MTLAKSQLKQVNQEFRQKKLQKHGTQAKKNFIAVSLFKKKVN